MPHLDNAHKTEEKIQESDVQLSGRQSNLRPPETPRASQFYGTWRGIRRPSPAPLCRDTRASRTAEGDLSRPEHVKGFMEALGCVYMYIYIYIYYVYDVYYVYKKIVKNSTDLLVS